MRGQEATDVRRGSNGGRPQQAEALYMVIYNNRNHQKSENELTAIIDITTPGAR